VAPESDKASFFGSMPLEQGSFTSESYSLGKVFVVIIKQYVLSLRNEFSSISFSSIRNLALWAVALEQRKASFFRGIPLGQRSLTPESYSLCKVFVVIN
jgi:hypothetical protein